MNEIYREPKINSIIGVSPTFNLTDEDLKKRGQSFINENTLRLAGVRRVSDDVGHQILSNSRPQAGVSFEGLAIPYFNFGDVGKLAIAEWTIRRDFPDFEITETGEQKESANTSNRRALKINFTYRRPCRLITCKTANQFSFSRKAK